MRVTLNGLKRKSSYIFLLGILLLVIFFIYQQMTNEQDTLGLFQKSNPETQQYNEITGSFPTYELFDGNGDFLQYAVFSSASGYGGEIKMLTLVNRDEEIYNAVIVEHVETPMYLKKVLEVGYLDKLKDRTISNLLDNRAVIDGVSGATLTSDGMLLAVSKGIAEVGKRQLNLSTTIDNKMQTSWQDGLVIMMLLLAGVAAAINKKGLRVWMLIASVIVIGFIAEESLTLGHFVGALMGKFPTFIERPIWYIFFLGVLLLTVIFGRNVYCNWLCPFGAVQEGIYRSLNLKSFRIDPKVFVIAKKSIWFFIWLAVIVALFSNNPNSASYEPFAVFFGGEGTQAQWIIMGIIVVMSILIYRLWCRAFCPVGTIFDFIAKGSKGVRNLFKNKKAIRAQVSEPVRIHASCGECDKCEISTPIKGKRKFQSLTLFNKSLIIVILLIDVLVFITLLQNTGILDS